MPHQRDATATTTASHEQRPGERADLVERLVHAEAAAAPDAPATWASSADFDGDRTALPRRSSRIIVDGEGQSRPHRGAAPAASSGTQTAVRP